MVSGEIPGPLPLLSLNHVSLVCRSVQVSSNFYERVLGFVNVKRPSSFDFEGAWLFNYGVGIHLLKCKTLDDLPKKSEINPRDNHTSFQCTDIRIVEKKLQEMQIKYVKRIVEEGGIYVDQLFFHDPDGYMIEICNCENLPVIPLSGSASCVRLKSNWISSSKINEQLLQGNYVSEITAAPQLFTANATPTQIDFPIYKKGIGSELRPCSAEVMANNDNKSCFLDIMDFYL